MKLQPASRKEITRITLGTWTGSVVMIGALFLLSLGGIGTFDLSRILLGALFGSAIAIGNFVILCLTVQSAVGITDQKRMKSKFQLSYNARMLIQGVWVVVALLVPQIHVVAGALPLLFPHMTILLLQFRGKLFPKKSSDTSADDAGSTEN